MGGAWGEDPMARKPSFGLVGLGNLGGVWGREIPYEEAFGQAQNALTPVGAQYAFARYYGWGAEGVESGPLGPLTSRPPH